MNPHETLHAAAISIIAEGVAIVLFLAMLFVAVAIYATSAAGQSYLLVPPTAPAVPAPNYGTSFTDQRDHFADQRDRWSSEQRERSHRMLDDMRTRHDEIARERRELNLEYRIRTLEQRLNSPFR